MFRRRFPDTRGSWLCLLCTCMIPLSAAFSALGAPSPDFSLETKWELTLQGNFMSFSFAVCPDGTLYVLHEDKVQMVSAEGKTIGNESRVENGVHPVACDGEHKLFLAREELSIYQPNAQGNVSRVWFAHLKMPVLGIVIAPDDSIYGMTDEEAPAIVLVLPSGKEELVKKEVRTVALTPEVTIHSCDMVWDKSRNRIAYTLPGESQIRFIDAPRATPKPSYGDESYEPSVHSCGLFGARQLVELPNGKFVRERIEKSEIAPALSRAYFEVLDGDLKILERLPATPRTFPIGSANDGSLYFASFQTPDPNSVTISKRALQGNPEAGK